MEEDLAYPEKRRRPATTNAGAPSRGPSVNSATPSCPASTLPAISDVGVTTQVRSARPARLPRPPQPFPETPSRDLSAAADGPRSAPRVIAGREAATQIPPPRDGSDSSSRQEPYSRPTAMNRGQTRLMDERNQESLSIANLPHRAKGRPVPTISTPFSSHPTGPSSHRPGTAAGSSSRPKSSKSQAGSDDPRDRGSGTTQGAWAGTRPSTKAQTAALAPKRRNLKPSKSPPPKPTLSAAGRS
jgi:hypothetical protein